MKKLNYLLLGLAGLTMASCSQDDLLNDGGDGNYAITVNLPADMATRASLGDDLLQAQTLHYAIFDMEGNFIDADKTSFPEGSSSTTVPLSLAAGSRFQIAFFAQSPQSETDGVYSFNADENAHSITVDYDAMKSNYNNEDDYDCFYKLFDTGVIGSSTNTQVTLNRLVAQINWGTNDFGNATVTNTFGTNLAALEATLTTEAYTVFDIITQEVSASKTVEIGAFTPNNASGAPSFPVGGYQYVAMQYVLVPAEKTIQTLNLQVTNTAGTANNPITVDNAPVQANYRTNIYGNLLTDNIEFTVDLSADWGGADYQVVESSSAFADALKAGGNVVLNSDIQLPSVVTISNDAVLDLNGHTIYGPSANNSSADGAITVTNGATLTIKGDGKMETRGTYASILLWALDGSTINIEGGTYQGNAPGEIIYIGGRENSTAGGTVNISGGTFISADDSMLNCKDADYKAGTAKFVVTGGIFYNWNPSESKSENPMADWVADGYEVVTTTDGSNTLYVVVPKGTKNKVVSNSSDLASAISANDGATIYLTPGTYSTPAAFTGNVTIKGLDPENTVLKANMGYWTANNAVINLSDLTVESYVNTSNHTSMAFDQATEQTFNNVTFVGEFHAESGIVNFTDCTFIYNKPSGTNYALWCEASTTVNISDCTMNCGNGKAILVFAGMSAPSDSEGGNITINGLTVTNTGTTNDKAVVEIHSEKYKSAGTIILNDVTYPSGVFGGGLWQEINNNTEQSTKFYTIYVNGVEEQKGTQSNN